MKNLSYLWTKYRTFILYCIIGVSGVTLDFLVFMILKEFMHYQIANVISINCGIMNNFWWNRNVNFRKKDHTKKRMISFFTVGWIGIGISALLLYIGVDVLGISVVYTKLFTLVVIILFQFTANSLISFRHIK